MKHKNAISRLKSVEGHIRGIQQMIQEDKYCMDVLHQINAVQAALNKISAIILNNHLNSCLIIAVRGDNPDERERVLGEILELFDAVKKV
jgi:DNA-binding FrmR family transcriptional regulator